MSEKKEPHWIECTGKRHVRLQLIKAIFTSTLSAGLGITATEPSGTGISVIGKGRQLALINGCFPIAVVYKRGATASNPDPQNLQTGKVMCSPIKSDTIFNTINTMKYRTFDIVEARPVRRRVFVV
jgi:hypothetical protein